MYRAAGPVEEQSLGETEFVTGVAAMSASGRHGPTRACAGIIGTVDLTAGDKGRPAARSAQGDRRQALLRHPQSHRLASVAGGDLEPGIAAAGTARASCFPRRRATAGAAQPAARRVVLPHAAAARGCAGPSGARADDRGRSCRRAHRHRSVRGQARGGLLEWKLRMAALAALPNTVVKLGGLTMYGLGLRLPSPAQAARSEELARTWKPYIETCIEAFGAGALHVREQTSRSTRACAAIPCCGTG